MREPQSTADLRILDEMCDEIEKHGVCALPGSLMSLVRTERGKRVAKLVEKLARDVSAEKWARQVEIEAAQRTLEAQQDTINSEREMNHQLTTELQRQASGRESMCQVNWQPIETAAQDFGDAEVWLRRAAEQRHGKTSEVATELDRLRTLVARLQEELAAARKQTDEAVRILRTIPGVPVMSMGMEDTYEDRCTVRNALRVLTAQRVERKTP